MYACMYVYMYVCMLSGLISYWRQFDFLPEQEMATEMFKADPDLPSIAILCHIAHPHAIKFRKLNIIPYKSKQSNLHILTINLFENLNSPYGDNFDNSQQQTATYGNAMSRFRQLVADLVAKSLFRS